MLSDVKFDRTLVITSRLTPSLIRWGHSMAVFQKSPWRPKKTKLFWQNFFQENKRGLGPFYRIRQTENFGEKSRPFRKQQTDKFSALPQRLLLSWFLDTNNKHVKHQKIKKIYKYRFLTSNLKNFYQINKFTWRFVIYSIYLVKFLKEI